VDHGAWPASCDSSPRRGAYGDFDTVGLSVAATGWSSLKDGLTCNCAIEPSSGISAFDMSNTTESRDQQRTNVAASQSPLDYYTILADAIKKTEQNSGMLRALVYERARFHLKREALFGYSSLGLTDILRHINELELAIARIEATAVDQQQISVYRPTESTIPTRSEFEAQAPPDAAQATTDSSSGSLVEIMEPQPPLPAYADFEPNVSVHHYFGAHEGWDAILRHVQVATRFVGFALLGFLFIGLVLLGSAVWYFPKNSALSLNQGNRIVTANNSGKPTASIGEQNKPTTEPTTPAIPVPPKLPYPIPTSFGIYALHNDKLSELDPLPINVPDSRVALSAEITKPSALEIDDAKPAFILFRRDLLNNAPQKVILRVVARMARETRVVNGKAKVVNVENAWRIRSISRELNVSPVPGQPEMVIARVDDNASLEPGRYALVLNRIGYEFTIKGPSKSLEFCLEGFETANGTAFTQCRVP
jgi:hypothetical protein